MATLVSWNGSRLAPLRELVTVQSEVSRLMNGLIEGNGRELQPWVPTLDAWETESEVVYAFDLPGVSQDAITVEAQDGVLTVSAERAQQHEVSQERFHRIERRFGSFGRSVRLPRGVSEGAITASYKEGVLEVRVPKPEQPTPHRITVAGQASGVEQVAA